MKEKKKEKEKKRVKGLKQNDSVSQGSNPLYKPNFFSYMFFIGYISKQFGAGENLNLHSQSNSSEQNGWPRFGIGENSVDKLGSWFWVRWRICKEVLGSYGSTLWYIPSSTPKKTPFSINVCTLCDFMCVCVSGLNLRNGFWVFIYFLFVFSFVLFYKHKCVYFKWFYGCMC